MKRVHASQNRETWTSWQKSERKVSHETTERRSRKCVTAQGFFDGQFYHPDSVCHRVHGQTRSPCSLGDLVSLKLNLICVKPDASKIVYEREHAEVRMILAESRLACHVVRRTP